MKGKIKFRDWLAVDAQFRNSSGAMKVKRQQEERSACRDFRKSWRDEASEAEDELDDTKTDPMYFDSVNDQEENE